MSKVQFVISEYNRLRGEVNNRVKLLHLFILAGVLINFLFVCLFAILIYFHLPTDKIVLLLLFIPIIFALLAFNYQANQMTLEGLAGFVNHELRKQLSEPDRKYFDEWDIYYGKFKKGYQLTSFLKVMALLTPMTLPIWIMIFAGVYLAYPVNLLAYFDLALFALVIFNFRYKIGK